MNIKKYFSKRPGLLRQIGKANKKYYENLDEEDLQEVIDEILHNNKTFNKKK